MAAQGSMSDVDEMVAWLRGVLDGTERAAERALAVPWGLAFLGLHDPRSILARVEVERRLIEAWATPDLDPAVMEDVLRLVAYGHRFDAEGYREEWAPGSVGADSTSS